MRRFGLSALPLVLSLIFPICGFGQPGGSQFDQYYLRDTNPGENFYGYDFPFVDINPNNPGRAYQGLFDFVFQHELSEGQLYARLKPDNVLFPSRIGMSFVFDLNNLQVIDYRSVNNGPFQTIITPFTLKGLAALGGFDHFNFSSQITGLPPGVSLGTWDSFGTFVPIGLPQYDPTHPYSSPLILFNANTGKYITIDRRLTSETPGLYYSEANPSAFGGYRYFDWATPSSIEFRDFPSVPASFLGVSDPKHVSTALVETFVTGLVGVGADGSVTKWDGLNTNLVWQSNLVTGDKDFRGFFSNPLGDGPPEVGGNIFGAQGGFSPVPEPSGVLLLAVGISGVAIPYAIIRKWTRDRT